VSLLFLAAPAGELHLQTGRGSVVLIDIIIQNRGKHHTHTAQKKRAL
jgi:hypothetical protein